MTRECFSTRELSLKAFDLRRDVLDLVFRSKTGHIGGDYSVIDVLTALYYRIMHICPKCINDPGRDRFILSKGHAAEALYVVLADRGFFAKEELQTYGTFGSSYIGHPTNKVRGIEMNSGSLGHGLSLAVGMALAAKMDGRAYRVYTVMGDGELAEGSVWEAAMAGSHYQLDNLTAIIDRNFLQISGRTEDVMSQEKLDERWSGFGWNVLKCDGNNMNQIVDCLERVQKVATKQPTLLIANTVKGSGVSFMENQAVWHHRIPTSEEYEKACIELAERRRNIEYGCQ